MGNTCRRKKNFLWVSITFNLMIILKPSCDPVSTIRSNAFAFICLILFFMCIEMGRKGILPSHFCGVVLFFCFVFL